MRGFVGASVLIVTIKNLWQNKVLRFVVIALVALLLSWLALHHYGNSKYQDGIAYQQVQDEKIQQQLKEDYQKRLDAANADRLTLNEEITNQKEKYRLLEKSRGAKSDKVQTKVVEYSKTSDGSKLCLDPKWLQLYKDSLPE